MGAQRRRTEGEGVLQWSERHVGKLDSLTVSRGLDIFGLTAPELLNGEGYGQT